MNSVFFQTNALNKTWQKDAGLRPKLSLESPGLSEIFHAGVKGLPETNHHTDFPVKHQ